MVSPPAPITTSRSSRVRSGLGTYLLRALLAVGLTYYVWLILDLALHPLALDFDVGASVAGRFLWAIVGTGVVALGAFILRRVPGNSIGPLVILWGVATTSWSTRENWDSPLLGYIAHLSFNLYSGVGGAVIVVLLLSFPAGHFYPRWAAPWTTLYVILNVIGTMFSVIVMSPGAPVASGTADLPVNPLFVPALVPFTDLGGTLGNLLTSVGLVGAFVSLVFRYRASSTREREQIKWFVWMVGVFFLFFAIWSAGGIVSPNTNTARSPLEIAVAGFLYYVLNAIPAIGIGLAILRNRLWDIDLLVNRTLVYGSLTALLALLYFGLIFLLQALLQGLFLQNNGVAIVVSTLAIAALFQPLRHRIQQVIDRRFYRRKYDAARTLASFTAALRDEVDLTQLSDHLLAVVEDTMEPTHVSLWLRPARSDGPPVGPRSQGAIERGEG